MSWQRLLLRGLGSTLPAVTVILCVFMGGLALGCFGADKVAKRIERPLLWYAALELSVAVLGIASQWCFSTESGSLSGMYDALAAGLFNLGTVNSFEPFNSVFLCRLVFVGLLLLLPTSFMGATFPFVSKFLNQLSSEIQAQGNAYICNLLGAAAGTVAAGFFMLPCFGLSTTIMIASCISIGVAVTLLVVSRLPTRLTQVEQNSPLCDATANSSSMLIPGLVVLANGAVCMSLQVIWSRLFSLLVGSSTYSVASVLSTSIVGLALGTVIGQKSGARLTNLGVGLGVLCGLVAVCLCVDLWLIQLLPWIFNLNHEFLVRSNSYLGYLAERILLISLVVLPVSIVSGSIFPFALHAQASSPQRHQALIRLYVLSSVGSILGAGLAGFVFIPLFGRIFSSGMESTISLMILFESFISTAVLMSSVKRRFAFVPALLSLTLFVRPAWNQSLMSSGIPFLSLPTKAATTKEIFDRLLSDSSNNHLLFYREGLNTTVTVNANRNQNIVYLKNDGKVEAALPFNPQRQADTSDQSTHFMLGRIPVLINPDLDKNVFVVGFGSGATCGGALSVPAVKKLRIAEIEPTIFETEHFFEQSNGHPLQPAWLRQERVVPFCGDARMWLNFAREKYDAIISQPAEPWISGSADLYTQQFWQLAKSKLNDRGCFCQWIQLYAIDPEFLAVLCRTFQSVFPNTYVFHQEHAGEILLLGTMQPLGSQDIGRLPAISILPDDLRARTLAMSTRFHNATFNTDNNLLTEYALPQRLYLSEQLIDENLRALGISN